ncbi:unnamed protein product [Ilex paraguariensis]|uniref:Beta-galactosidase n=1 Tax=Ilex paraguariensis TaxID=185542 RepID=A0ABC8TFX6_9AQUA
MKQNIKKLEMTRWQSKGSPKKIVQMMKNEKLFESQGGPIILSLIQPLGVYNFDPRIAIICKFIFVKIENEYGPKSKAYGVAGYVYMTWAGKMATELDTEVPWLMCKEDNAPNPVGITQVMVSLKWLAMGA